MKYKLMLVSCLTLLLSACSKLSLENYNQLETGMKYEEVINIIGSPSSCDEKLGARSCIWGDSAGTNIKAKFLNETAVFFSHDNLK